VAGVVKQEINGNGEHVNLDAGFKRYVSPLSRCQSSLT